MRLFQTLGRVALTAVLLLASVAYSRAESPQRDGQKVPVSGVILDDTQQPVVGAVLFVEGNTGINTMTDAEGRFSFQAPAGSTIQVACVGYIPHSFTAVSGQQTIRLMSDIQSLEEAVAVGYGTQKKASLTGAISNIGEKAIQATTTTSVVTKLQGKVSGLNIRNRSGQPGEFDNVVNVRGFGAPLYVIDGINRTANDFQRLNSEDIESISVLKDASAAIYGLNAANGVILVTTKKGNSYDRARFQFNTNFGFSSPTDQVDMADAYEYYYLRNAANINSGADPFISPEELEKWRTGEYKSTNWADEVFRKFSLRQEYSLSAEGGSEKVQYYFNVNYTDDGGMLKTGDINYNKWSFRSNVTAQLTEDLKASVNVAGYQDEREAPYSNFFNIWRGTVNSLPYKSVYANDTAPYYNSVKDGQSYNPVALASIDNTGYARYFNNSIQATFNLTYVPAFWKDLTLSGTLAYDKRFSRSKNLYGNWTMYNYDEENDKYIGEDWNGKEMLASAYNNTRWITTQLQATWKKTIADAHHFGIMAAFETRQSEQDYDNIQKYFDFYSNDQLDYAGDTNMKATGNTVQTRNISYIGRFNYDFKERYLLEVAARYDGSYRYHPDVRWGLFPVVSAGWRISEESFMKGIKWLSNLKIRGSFGQIGEDVGNPFQYIPGFTTSGGGWTEFSEGVTTEGVATPALVNEKMTWTKSNIANIGLDASFLDNTLSFSVDVFRKHKKGILAYRNVSLPNTFGATFPQENLNSNRTQGIEFSASYQNRIGDFFYSVSGNATWARTMNWYIESSEPVSQWNKYRNYGDHRWSGLQWVYNVVGQFQNQEEIDNWAVYSASTGMKYVLPGDWKYEDVNGDGVIDGDDLRPISMSTDINPLWNYGMTLAANWRGLDVNILLQGAAGFKTYHDLTYTTPFWQESNIPTWFMDAWHHEDPFDASSAWVPGSLPSVRTNANAPYLNQYASTKSYQDCSYLRIKNIEVGYTLNQKFLRKAHIEKIRVFGSVNNLYTFANKYVKAYDPETIAGSANTGWVYPLMRTFNAGVNLYF